MSPVWSRWRRPRPRAVPVPETVELARGERVLATAATSGEDVVVITTHRLVVPGGELTEGRPWHLVDRGRWDPETDLLSVSWVDHGPAGSWTLTDAGGVPDVFQERVQASIVLVEEVTLDRQRRARVVLRKELATGRMLAQTIVGRGCDPDDPELVAATEAVADRLAEQVGREA